MKRKKKSEDFVVKESSERYISNEEVITVIERLPELIKKKPVLKEVLRDIFRDVFVDKEEIAQILYEIRLQRESSDRRFEEMDRRFEMLIGELRQHREDTNRRFEEVYGEMKLIREDMNRRFEEMRVDMDKRFEQMREDSDKRFEKVYEEMKLMRADMDNRFGEVYEEMKLMREDMDKRFEQMREDSDRRFEKVYEEMRLMREDMDKRFEQMREDSDKRFEKVYEEMKLMREDMDKRFEQMREDMDKRFEQMREDSDRRFEKVYEELALIRDDFHNAVSSIGGRWGSRAERAFREGIKEILKKYFNADVKEFFIDDNEGIVKGRPGRYQVDLLITDASHIIIEVKAQADEMDVNKLHKLGIVYEKQYGIKPRLILLTPFAREEAWAEARDVEDVEILTTPRQFKP